jgi:uncharacterized protein (UPF0332 family)
MQLDEKARENLEAVERLLVRSDDGQIEPLSNAAASRAYYAAYQAVADCAHQQGLSFDSHEPQYYRHDTLPDRAHRWGILDEDSTDDLARLRDLRVKADYYKDMVEYDEASEAQVMARRIVATLLDRSRS